MKSTMKVVFASLVTVIALAVGGCASTSGNAGLQNGSSEQIVEGKSTMADVRQLLGEPTQAHTADNGDKIWMYYFSESKVYPIFGLNKVDTKTLNIRFNKKGIVVAKDAGQNASRF